MIESQFKAICRLNRLLAVTGFAVCGVAIWQGETTGLPVPVVMGISGVSHLIFLMLNEFLLKMVKRVKEADLSTVLHLSVFIPVVYAAYIGLNYCLTGNALVLGLSLFSVLQAQFLTRVRLGRVLALAWLAVLAVSVPFGLPHIQAISQSNFLAGLAVVGFVVYYYGSLVSKNLRTQTTQMDKLQSMAATDVLTGLTNRRQFNNRLHEEIARARRHQTPLTLALFDLDDFKRLNDVYGHPVGDRILRELGKLIRNNIRESDLPARYGGEEFALILPETKEAEGHDLLERLRVLVSQTVFCLPEIPLAISVSIGVAQLDARQHTAFELVELADKALYEAKRLGKNQVVKGSALMPKILLAKEPTEKLFEPRKTS